MREDRRRRYDDGFRREALELIKSGAGKATLVRRLAIPVYTARNWIGAVQVQRRGGGHGRRRQQTLRLGDEGRVPEGEGRVPGKTPGPAGVQVTRRERSAVVRLLAGRGHRLDHLLRIAGLPKSTYYHRLSRPAHVSRPDVEPMVREIWDGSTSTNGGGRSSNAPASAGP